jgi:hypothetical protein
MDYDAPASDDCPIIQESFVTPYQVLLKEILLPI